MEQPGWWDHVETEPQAGPTLEQRARKLVNVLGAAERARKLRWLLSGDPALLTLMEAEVQRDGVTDPRRQGGAMKSICMAFPSATKAWTRSLFVSLTSISLTKERSILRESMGSRCR